MVTKLEENCISLSSKLCRRNEGQQREILPMPFSGRLVQTQHCDRWGRTQQSGLCAWILPFKWSKIFEDDSVRNGYIVQIFWRKHWASIVGLFGWFLGSMSYIRTLSLQLRGCLLVGSYPYFVSDTIYSPLFSMHELDKIAHVSHVPGSASVRCIGRPAFLAVDSYLAPAPASLGWVPGSAPSA